MKKTSQMSLTFTQDTKDRLRQYAEEKRTSVSQIITQWIWSVELQSEKKDGEK